MKKILITARPWEIRIAIIQDTRLLNIYFDSKHNYQLEKSFIKGKIIKVFPGMQTAFVEIGQEKAGFLHISEIDRTLTREKTQFGKEKEEEFLLDNEDNDDLDENINLKKYNKNINITEILEKGETLLVQISKEPIGTKGPKLTTCFTLPGRFIILMPNIPKIGISKKIIDFNERKRLKSIVSQFLPPEMGCIIRTTSEGRNDFELSCDIKYLVSTWAQIKEKYKDAPLATCIHKDIDLVYQIIRDNLDHSIEAIICDNKDMHHSVSEFISLIAPEFVHKNFFYEETGVSLFDHYNIEKQIQTSLQSKTELSNGGSIILETTEAMTVIDVNTARFTGGDNQNDTILKTNLEAAKEIVRQLKLRNIGGLIVIDFIDMNNNPHKNKLFSFLETTLWEEDKYQSVVLKISEFGLVQMTRKRTGKTLKNQLMKNCCFCNGTGMIKSTDERTYELLRIFEKEIMKKASIKDINLCIITVHTEIAKNLLNKEFNSILFFEKTHKIKIIINESEDKTNIYSYHFEWVIKKST